ncbi:D-alanyl-D-alanine carboxypeptidase family protein [Olsenella massiliensis]|uniref:D-alanyl-D-alanine carboxypeptidase family protein n=1 Tax=Olsenella massiliensis TaxID=1622075 RepID=UPI00071D2E29|nr:D-alanyl-D-alanine carboxypeptidase family protein [Olsenella massiliensis]
MTREARRRPSRLLLTLAVMLMAALLTPARAWADEPALSEAQAYVLVDQGGNVLASQNADQQMEPASITKIMTAMVALDSGKDLDDACTLTRVTYDSNAQLAGIATGDVISFRNLLQVMLVYSANDAADNVALAVSGSTEDFVARMNEKAREIGMTNTHFSNTHGLSEDAHRSTAEDLVKMGAYALEHYPFIARTVRMRSVTATFAGTQTTYASTDELMDSYAGLIGIKTGSVESGYTFLGCSERSGVRLYSCVLGCATNAGRFGDTARLMDWGYESRYQRRTLSRAKLPVRIVNASTSFFGRLLVVAGMDASGLVLPERDIAWSSTMLLPGSLVDPGSGYGSSVWTQDGRTVCAETYLADTQTRDLPQVNVFALPLFVNMDELLGAA